ncbi:unnamed protein product, partial [Heterosigma akashiwo]
MGLKYRKYPVMQILHMLPAPLWSVLAPIQFMSGLRKRFPWAHRYIGRAFVLMSCMIGTGLLIILKHNVYYGDVWLERPASIFASCYFMGSLHMAVSNVLRRNFPLHREWMIRHTFCGFGVHLMRLLIFLNGAVFGILP